ncbi:MAG TPA: ABC transporter permease [Syntrophorhabdaceae bacterium]|nr:ABC transporter permease [Syntrophorhabdaceae bacterium]
MLSYIVRRFLLAIPTVIGVCLVTFLLFNVFASPEAVARKQLGKNPTETQIAAWVASHGMDKPMFFNLHREKDGRLHPFDSRFWNHMRELVLFQFPESDYLHEKVTSLLKQKIGPSLSLTVPAFLLSMIVTLPIALFIAYYRGTYIDKLALFICVILMSIAILNYIIFGQYLLAVVFKYFPIYGYDFGVGAWKFLLLPVILAVASGLGGGVRFYRTIMLNEVRADYVRTAMAKGVSEEGILFKHVLKNAMIPILTTTVLSIPFLITGSLLLEIFFGIPGMGNLMINAINNHDYPVIRTLVYIYSLLYIAGSILTDISYTLVDPRVSFK